MKKNRTTKIAIIVLALVLATSCFVGTTLAKYTTKISGNDTARVAKWGVVLEADTDLFDASYDLNKAGAEISVDAHDDKNVIAPGTTKTTTAATFTITGDPEVDVKVLITLSGDPDDASDDLTMVTLPAGNYTNYTDFNDTDGIDVAADYNPVVWTLVFDHESDDGKDYTVTGNLQAIEDKFAEISSDTYGVYDVNATANKSDFTNICGTYTLSWVWSFDDNGAGTYNVEDTLLGQIAAGIPEDSDLPANFDDKYVANETFKLLITVDQVD